MSLIYPADWKTPAVEGEGGEGGRGRGDLRKGGCK